MILVDHNIWTSKAVIGISFPVIKILSVFPWYFAKETLRIVRLHPLRVGTRLPTVTSSTVPIVDLFSSTFLLIHLVFVRLTFVIVQGAGTKDGLREQFVRARTLGEHHLLRLLRGSLALSKTLEPDSHPRSRQWNAWQVLGRPVDRCGAAQWWNTDVCQDHGHPGSNDLSLG